MQSNQTQNEAHGACGTVTSPLSQLAGLSNASIGGQALNTNYFPQTSYGYTYSWPYYDGQRVAALEAKVELLEKMLAAVLSGRDVPKPRRRRA